MRVSRKARLASFLLLAVAGAAATLAQERRMGGVGITVFANRNFEGRSATFRDDVSNLRDSGLNDRIWSLRVGPGEMWEVCEDRDYRGPCVVVSGDEPDLGRTGWSNRISSMRRVRNAPPPRPRPQPEPEPPHGGSYIVVFERPNYRGAPHNFEGSNPILQGFSGRAGSVTIGRGIWEVCSGPNFSGRCVTFKDSVPDLGAYGMRDQVGSVRPARYQSPGPPGRPDRDLSIVLYDRTNYRGTQVNYDGPAPSLGEFSGRAGSVTIGRGIWELCEGPNYSGRCVTLEESVPDLGAYGMRNRVGSLRPARRQPR